MKNEKKWNREKRMQEKETTQKRREGGGGGGFEILKWNAKRNMERNEM